MFAADEISYTGETGAGAAVAPASSSGLRPSAVAGLEPVDAIPLSEITRPAPMLNVDRSFTPAPVATIAPAQGIRPATTAAPVSLETQAAAYTWLRAHWWQLGLLLLLLVIAYAATRRSGSSSSSTHLSKSARDQATRNIMAKGSPEARERMAQLRAMKKAG